MKLDKKFSFSRSKHQRTVELFEQILQLQALKLPLQVCLARLLPIQKDRQLEKILIELNHGQSLSEALDKVQDEFDPLGLELLKLAAHSPNAYRAIAVYLEQHQLKKKLKQKILEASFYPLLLLSLSILVGFIFQTQVKPLYQSFGQALIGLKPSTSSTPPYAALFLGGGLVIGLLSHQKLRYKLPWIGQLQSHLDWLTWLQIMVIAGDAGFNFSQALAFALPYIRKLCNYPWHCQFQQELAFGNTQFPFPPSLPPVSQNILALCQISSDWLPIFHQAGLAIQSEIEAQINKIERYLQPLLLLIITGACAYLAKLIYSPLLQLGNILV